ncbi:hypothetical protein Moror_8314 [Moniliophthora roreri MCA 2997]|uniref:Uncharacterized protein n=2 Tax=Moniliophthora roreri TaxID=221103 RepID=V2X517_MONRO|nr:hypothetical protein Moror_8314 [Moniliophthora roreri MCA 2997]KAI3607495.1 hypothetical protein WG66_005154 [Moniliophthora roreri]
MSSTAGATAQDKNWKSKEQADEARHIHDREQAQLAALREQMEKEKDRDFEGGFGGQENLEDRYATTSGEH